MKTEVNHQDRLAHGYKSLEAAVGISHTKICEEIKLGRLRKCKIGKKTIFLREDVDAWLASLRRQSEPGTGNAA